MNYRPDIDGLRAVAILAVLLYHIEFGFTGGYVGVDVFFVISGYLIAGLILRDLDQDRFRIVEFWQRRIRRILPALALVVFATLVAGWRLLIPLHYEELGESVVAQALLVSNFYFWKQSGYFAQDMHLKPLLHTWSLAVEEQFYLLFPFLFMLVKRISRRSLAPVMLVLCAGSFALSVYCSYWHDLANFYLLPTRAWELLLGALLCAMPAKRTTIRRVAECAGLLGIGAILWAALFYTERTRFPGLCALLPCAGAAMIIRAGENGMTAVGRFLASRAMVFTGLISYSLYLWHWPILVFARNFGPEPLPIVERLALMALSLPVAALSWKFVETPFRRRVLLSSRAGIFAFAGVTTAALLVVGLIILETRGIPDRLSPQAKRYAQAATDRAFMSDLSLEQVQRREMVELGAGDKSRPVELLVWGDSHAMAALPMVDLLCREHSVRGVAATHSADAPLVGYTSIGAFSLREQSAPFNDAVLKFIRDNHVGDILLVASWDGYVNLDHGTARLSEGMQATVSAIRDSGSRLWIMKNVPVHTFNVPEALVSAVLCGKDPQTLGLPLEEHRRTYKMVDPIFDGINQRGAMLLDPTDLYLGPSGLCRVAQDGQALYADSHHLTTPGAMLLRPLFEQIFQSIITNRKEAH